jgi:signal peptidase II
MTEKFYRKAWCWYLVSLVVVVLDQWSKQAVLARFDYAEVLPVMPFFNLTLVFNPGAAFSFLSDAGGWQRWFFTAIALLASLVLVVWIARVAAKKIHEAFALAFILGGALGNLYDRILLGHVVDFIQVYYQESYFPAFNLADSAITLGAIILIADMLLNKEKSST